MPTPPPYPGSRERGAEALLKVAAIQTEPHVGDKEHNNRRALELIHQASDEGVGLMVLPELGNSGYIFNSRAEVAELAEPVLEVEGPGEFQGALIKTIMQRRGTVIGTTEEDGGFCRIESEVPLCEMFGYATELRSSTQGKAEFTMEFSRYLPAPSAVQQELKEKYKSQLITDDG